MECLFAFPHLRELCVCVTAVIFNICVSISIIIYSLLTFLHNIALINSPLIINYYILSTIHTEAACVRSAPDAAHAHICIGSSAWACLEVHPHTYTRRCTGLWRATALATPHAVSVGRPVTPPLRCGSVLASSCVKPFRSNLFVCCLLYMHMLTYV